MMNISYTYLDTKTLEELLDVHRRNLAHLETQSALFGKIDTPVNIINSIEQTQTAIKEIKAEIDRRSKIDAQSNVLQEEILVPAEGNMVSGVVIPPSVYKTISAFYYNNVLLRLIRDGFEYNEQEVHGDITFRYMAIKKRKDKERDHIILFTEFELITYKSLRELYPKLTAYVKSKLANSYVIFMFVVEDIDPPALEWIQVAEGDFDIIFIFYYTKMNKIYYSKTIEKINGINTTIMDIVRKLIP